MHLQPPGDQIFFFRRISVYLFSSAVFRSRVCNSGRFCLIRFRLCSIFFMSLQTEINLDQMGLAILRSKLDELSSDSSEPSQTKSRVASPEPSSDLTPS